MFKSMILSATILMSMQSALAMSTSYTAATCLPATPLPDTSVEITVTGNVGEGYVAQVQKFFLGRRWAQFYANLQEDQPKADRPGSGYRFYGERFDLEICTDCAPNDKGLPATATYEYDGQREQMQFVCKVN